jgi:hypothetical protein
MREVFISKKLKEFLNIMLYIDISKKLVETSAVGHLRRIKEEIKMSNFISCAPMSSLLLKQQKKTHN